MLFFFLFFADCKFTWEFTLKIEGATKIHDITAVYEFDNDVIDSSLFLSFSHLAPTIQHFKVEILIKRTSTLSPVCVCVSV